LFLVYYSRSYMSTLFLKNVRTKGRENVRLTEQFFYKLYIFLFTKIIFMAKTIPSLNSMD